MRIVHPKDAHSAVSPKQHNALDLGPEFAPVFAPKIQGINVFVFLRRVLRVLDRAVCPSVKPFGMLFHVRVIGRAIQCKIEGNFHSAFSHFFLKPVEIGQRPERRFDRLMSAGLAADRPRHARVARLAGERVVPPFAIGVTNRMNRRKINDVETHCLRVVEPRQTIAESRSAIVDAFCGAWKKFIPRPEQCCGSIDDNPRSRAILRRVGAIRIRCHQHFQLRGLCDGIDF